MSVIMRSFSVFRRATTSFRGVALLKPRSVAPRYRFFSTVENSDIDAKWKELDHLRSSLGSDADETINMMSHLANVLRDTGKLDSAADLYKEAETEVRKKYGDQHPHTYSSVANLGTIYGLLGKVDEGIPLLREAVDGFEPLGDMYRQPLVQALSYLSLLLHRTGKLDEALPCYEKAIEERKLLMVTGERPPEEGMDILGEYGVLQRDLKHFDASVEALETALKTSKECAQSGLADPAVAYLSFQLAASYQAAGKLSQAEDLYREIYANKVVDFDNMGFKEVMSRYEAVLIGQRKFEELDRVYSELLPTVTERLGESDRVSIYCLTVLAKARHGLNDFSGCCDLLKKGIRIMENSNEGGIYTFDIAQLQTNLAAVLHATKEYEEAESYYKFALDGYLSIITERLKDLPQPSVKALWDNTILAHRNYAVFLEDTGRFSNASSLYSQLLDHLVSNGAGADEIKLTIGCYNTLALKLHEELKNYVEAEFALRTCLHHQTLCEGEEAEDTLVLRVNLADNLRRQDKLMEAETHLHIAVPALTALLGKCDQTTIFGMNILGAVYRGLEKFSNAEPLLRDILDCNIANFGLSHPEVLLGKCNLGICLSRLYATNEGKVLIIESVKGLKDTVGPTHDATVSAMCSLAACILDHNKDEAIEVLEETLGNVRQVYSEDHDVYKYVEKQLNHAMAA